MAKNSDLWTRVGVFGAASSAAEIGLGSVVHSLHLPFAGHVMANLQGIMLAAYLNRRREYAPYTFGVSAISGALKSLSPSGKKFRPMLAILSQGFLFHGAVNTLGTGLLGITAGQMLIGMWCSFQPFLLQYIFFGQNLFKSYAGLFQILEQRLPWGLPSPLWLLMAWIGLSGLISAAIALAAHLGVFWKQRSFHSAPMNTPANAPALLAIMPPWRESVFGAVHELRRPYFILPFIFVIGFAWLGNSRLDHLAYLSLRATLAAFCCGLFIRRLNFVGIIRWMQRRGWAGPATALETATSELPHRLQQWKPQKQSSI